MENERECLLIASCGGGGGGGGVFFCTEHCQGPREFQPPVTSPDQPPPLPSPHEDEDGALLQLL